MATPPRDKTRVFISYARADGETFAADLRTRLEKEHPEITLWQDRVKMEGGRDWWLQITEAIQNVEFMVLVMTPAALASKTVQREWRYARSQGICVYPVKAAPALDFSHLPKWMSSAHWYDLDKEWSKFINDLNTRCEVAKVPFMAEEMPSDFVERPAEYNALKAALLEPERGDPVAITAALRGAGGFGKTTLAKALCHDDDLQTAFDDGILWVTLGENPNVIDGLNTLINALSRERLSIANFEEAILKLGDLLADRDCLIVIDDVWDSSHLRPFLRNGPRCARLVTTRLNDVLPLDTQKIKVDAMLPSEAVQLLRNGIVPSGDKSAELDFRALAQRLGEWPLLLKLANGAMRRRMETGESPAQAMAWVEKALTRKGFKALDDPGNKEGRHRAAAITLQVSLELLSDSEFHQYARLAIFPEDVDVPLVTLEKLWDLDDFDTDERCGRFFGLSLLLNFDRSSHTIRLHDVVRTFLQDEHRGKLASWHEAFLAHWHTQFEKWADLPADEPYLWDWLAYHLIEAGHGEELVQTVKDLRYLAHKTHARDAAGAERDLRAAEKVVPDDALLRILRRHFVNAGHFLKRAGNPKDIAATLHSRLQHLAELQTSCHELEATLPRPFMRAGIRLDDLPHPALIRTLSGHSAEVLGCAISPNGQFIVSASADRTLKVWEVATGQELRTLSGHSDKVLGCAISPNGQFIVSASADRTLKVWEVETGQELQTLTGHSSGVNECAISPDGQFIISAAVRTLKIWEMATGQEVRTLDIHSDLVSGRAISPDGQLIVCHDETLSVWEMATGQEVRTLYRRFRHSHLVYRNAISPDEHFIVTILQNYTLSIWEVETGQELHTLTGHSNVVKECAISPDGHFIVSASADRTLKIWEVATGRELHTLTGHSAGVNGCAISPDGQFIASASSDGTLKVWEVTTRQEPYTHTEHSDKVLGSAISPNGQFVASASSDGTLKVWEVATGQELHTLTGHSNGVKECAISPDGQFIVSASTDRTLKIWEVATGQELHTLTGHRFGVNGCTISLDGKFIVSASYDQTLKIWEMRTGQEVRTFKDHSGSVNACAVSPDGQFIVSASEGRTLKVWDIATGQMLHRLTGHSDSVWGCAISPDGRFIVSASGDKTLKIWKMATGQEVHTLNGHSDAVGGCAISPDGQFIASASGDKTLKIWKVTTGDCLTTLSIDGWLTSVAWHPDGEQLIAGGEKGLYWLRFVQ